MATSASPDDGDGELELETKGVPRHPKNASSVEDLIEQLLGAALQTRADKIDDIDPKVFDEFRRQQDNEKKLQWAPGFLRKSLSSLSSLIWKPIPIESRETEEGQASALEPTMPGQTNYTSPLLDVTVDNQRTCQDCSAHQPQSSAHWIQIHPTFSGDNTAITHSFRSFAGRYECGVSGLRWVCEGEVHFSYLFSSWEPYRQMLKTMMYAPVGPLLDITVTAGQLKEVYLPHFACLGGPSLVDNIKVVHIEEDCNISIEQVCDLTPFYVKLLHPTFSPKGVLLRTGLPINVHCNLMLYQAPRAHLTIHAYLIPCDASIEQAVEKQEALYGHRRIPKPKPEKSFKMKDFFSLRTSCPSEVIPDKIKLRYPRNTPNYFEVYIKEAKFDLGIDLLSKHEVTWSLKIREVEYRETVAEGSQEEHFVDYHRSALIQRVSEVKQVMDQLLAKQILSSEAYDVIRAESTHQDQLRALYTGPLKAGGTRSKDAFYEILKRLERNLIKDLEGG